MNDEERCKMICIVKYVDNHVTCTSHLYVITMKLLVPCFQLLDGTAMAEWS